MKLNTIYPVIATTKLKESRDFYTRHFGFIVVFENEWYVHLVNGAFQLAFMLPDHSSQHPMFRPAFDGKGITLSFEVNDAQKQAKLFREEGLHIEMNLQQEEWGELHFALYDPSGMAVNITQMVEPAEDYKSYYVDVLTEDNV